MKWLKHMMYSCRYATLLVEKRAEKQLTVKERLQLKWHTLGCTACSLYGKQSVYMNKLFRKWHKKKLPPERPDKNFIKRVQKRVEEVWCDKERSEHNSNSL